MLTVNLTSGLSNHIEKIKYDNNLQVKPALDLSTPSMYYSQYEHNNKLIKENTGNTNGNCYMY
jgi:hypothetical protein